MRLIFVALLAVFAATASFGGMLVEPPVAEPEASGGDSEDGVGTALFLLALVGMVVASGQLGGLAGRIEFYRSWRESNGSRQVLGSSAL